MMPRPCQHMLKHINYSPDQTADVMIPGGSSEALQAVTSSCEPEQSSKPVMCSPQNAPTHVASPSPLGQEFCPDGVLGNPHTLGQRHAWMVPEEELLSSAPMCGLAASACLESAALSQEAHHPSSMSSYSATATGTGVELQTFCDSVTQQSPLLIAAREVGRIDGSNQWSQPIAGEHNESGWCIGAADVKVATTDFVSRHENVKAATAGRAGIAPVKGLPVAIGRCVSTFGLMELAVAMIDLWLANNQ